LTIIHRVVPLAGDASVEIATTDNGAGRPYLLLHGGAGPQSMDAFAEELASVPDTRVIVPTHPGFGGMPRPDTISSVRDLSRLYLALLDALDLDDVTVIGNSVGGWITAELALLASPRLGRIVLIDAVGIEVPGHPVADFFALTMEQVFSLSFHDPAAFRFDPASLPPSAQAIAASNRETLSVYAGAGMSDPTLAGRLSGLDVSALILWGDSDGIVDPDYGRAYAAAIPGAVFRLLHETGHMPQMETPEQTLAALGTGAHERP
jgi:pimeloyl-ACP methyl ester carboxylesterase